MVLTVLKSLNGAIVETCTLTTKMLSNPDELCWSILLYQEHGKESEVVLALLSSGGYLLAGLQGSLLPFLGANE